MFKKVVYPLIVAALVFATFGATAGVALAKGGDPNNLSTCQTMKIKVGQKVNLSSGNTGVNMPASGYAGTLEVCRASGLRPQRTKDVALRLLRPAMWWTVDKHGETQDVNLHGSTYVFFQLPAAYEKAAKSGTIAIYRWNSGSKYWVKLPTTMISGHGVRLSARATGFGYYAIAMEAKEASTAKK